MVAAGRQRQRAAGRLGAQSTDRRPSAGKPENFLDPHAAWGCI